MTNINASQKDIETNIKKSDFRDGNTMFDKLSEVDRRLTALMYDVQRTIDSVTTEETGSESIL